MNDPQKELAASTADLIDEMLDFDGRASVAWRQAARALRAGDIARALELLGSVSELVGEAKFRADTAARGMLVLGIITQFDAAMPDKCHGEDLEKFINLTTPPHAKNGTGEN